MRRQSSPTENASSGVVAKAERGMGPDKDHLRSLVLRAADRAKHALPHFELWGELEVGMGELQ